MDKRFFIIFFHFFLHAGRLLSPEKEVDSLLLRLARIHGPFFHPSTITTNDMDQVWEQWIDIYIFYANYEEQLELGTPESKFKTLKDTIESFLNKYEKRLNKAEKT